MSMYRFDEWMNSAYGHKLDFDIYLPKYNVNLQRPLVWTPIQKEQLIISLLRDVPMPRFVLVERVDDISGRRNPSTFLVLDGKQRMNTIFEFIRNEFSISYKEKQIFFDDLSNLAKQRITDPHPCTYDVHYSYPNDAISDDTLIYLFELVNFLGTPQDKQHLETLKKLQND